MDKTTFLDQTLPFVSKASRYLGNEINAVHKRHHPGQLRFALCFPDVYEVGMSHMGLHILYHILNACNDIVCERAFAPWPDMERLLRARELPLSTLESGTPLRHFDIVGFSLEYELGYATVLRMLELGGIALNAADRSDGDPLVIGGGPSTCNPEPVADFFDAFVIGDGEECIVEISRIVADLRRAGADRAVQLAALRDVPGVYVPSEFTITYGPDRTISAITPRTPGYTRVRRRIATDFSRLPFCTRPIVPYMQIIHDRAAVEIARGCSRGCRFCMAGMIYRPVREKDPATVCRLALETLDQTGYEELALASLSTGDYSCIAPVLQYLMQHLREQRVAVSFPSLRAGTLTRDLMEMIKTVRKTGFTIAPEAGTQRLRDVINKGITEADIIGTAQQVFAAGWKLIKLYFMIGLPTETEADIQGMVTLVRQIAGMDKRRQINVGVSAFVPKPHTPFQWEAQLPPRDIDRTQALLRDQLHRGRVRLKWQDPQLSLLEGIFSRGDRRLGAVLRSAHARGAGLESWSEHFDPDIWRQAFTACDIEPDWYLRARGIDEILPWDHIDCGADKTFLLTERDRARRAESTPDCRRNACSQCGTCTDTIMPELVSSTDLPVSPDPAVPATQPSVVRYRLRYTKLGPARFLSHLEFTRCLARTLRRAKMPVRYSQGFHPMPRLITYAALPVGMQSMGEFCDVELTERVDGGELQQALNARLPEGLHIIEAAETQTKTDPTAGRTKAYTIEMPPVADLRYPDNAERHARVAAFFAADRVTLAWQRKGRQLHTDLKQIVASLCVGQNGELHFTIAPADQPVPRADAIAGAVLKLDENQRLGLKLTCRYADEQP